MTEKLKILTCIGSRGTPGDIQSFMTLLGKSLGDAGFFLRTGDAVGADTAFTVGWEFSENPQNMRIYTAEDILEHKNSSAVQLAIDTMVSLHPNPQAACRNPYTEALLSRDVLQVLGDDCKSPSNMIICWTTAGKLIGGTAMAMRVAMAHNIPIINLGNPKHLDAMVSYYKNGSLIERINKFLNMNICEKAFRKQETINATV